MRLAWMALMAASVFGQQADICARPGVGDFVLQPPELRSSDGILRAEFSLRSDKDADRLARYCYISGENIQSPTLRVQPGDEVILTLRNELASAADTPGLGASAHRHSAPAGTEACGHGAVTVSSSNLHFHGVNIPPVCHQDEVVRTLVQPGDPPFEYRFRIPANQPAGLYWYHPHPHGFTERQVQGGASGALIVEGIEKARPALAGLGERILVLRDQPVDLRGEAGETGEDRWRPALDASINYVPLMFVRYRPAVMLVQPEKKELWRILNASSDTFFDLQLLCWPPGASFAQPFRVVGVDGVPAGAPYDSLPRTSYLIPPGGRAELVITTPPAGMHAQLVTNVYDNGAVGDRNTYRVLADLRSSESAPPVPSLPGPSSPARTSKFDGLEAVAPARERTLYFSEKIGDPGHPKGNTAYFITVEGAKPKAFDMSSRLPNITAVQGTVEDWIIENRAPESHVFHIHQLHFQVLERDGKRSTDQILHDTIDLPFWDGKSAYPKIKVRMDFRDPAIVGTFPYHCHILEHEDAGMMGMIEIVRPVSRTRKHK